MQHTHVCGTLVADVIGWRDIDGLVCIFHRSRSERRCCTRHYTRNLPEPRPCLRCCTVLHWLCRPRQVLRCVVLRLHGTATQPHPAAQRRQVMHKPLSFNPIVLENARKGDAPPRAASMVGAVTCNVAHHPSLLAPMFRHAAVDTYVPGNDGLLCTLNRLLEAR